MKIMVVDDRETYSEFIKYNKDEKGVTVYSVTNPHEALEYMKEEKFDFIILEMIMNKMNSIEFLNRAKKFDPDVKVIVHSKFMDYGFEKLAKIKGFYGYYTKPSILAIKKDILNTKEELILNTF